MGRRVQSEVETRELLLVTHFPNSVVTGELEASTASRCSKRLNWRVAAKVIAYRRVE